MDTNPAHVELPLIPLIKETSTGKSDGDNVKLKLRRDPKSSTLHRYEFRVPLFDHGKPEQFLLFVRNFQMNLASTGTLDTEEKVQHLCVIVCGEALRQVYLLSDDVENADTSLTVDDLLKGLAWHFPL